MTTPSTKNKPEKSNLPALVRAEAIAKILDCSGRNVRLLADAGKIPCHRISGRIIRFNLSAVLKALDITL